MLPKLTQLRPRARVKAPFISRSFSSQDVGQGTKKKKSPQAEYSQRVFLQVWCWSIISSRSVTQVFFFFFFFFVWNLDSTFCVCIRVVCIGASWNPVSCRYAHTSSNILTLKEDCSMKKRFPNCNTVLIFYSHAHVRPKRKIKMITKIRIRSSITRYRPLNWKVRKSHTEIATYRKTSNKRLASNKKRPVKMLRKK